MEGARNEGWDPSVAALAAFPDVVNNLNHDIRWTQDLGNAFLAQQADVMDAVQRMRAKAQANGKLQSNSQYDVSTDTQDGRSAIEIQPANPQVVYVPEYDPAWVWGPPLVGYYPPLWYPGLSVGFGFGPGIYIGSFFGGCCGWGGFGWGWQPHWFDRQIYVNNYFMHRYGFNDYHGGAFRGTDAWVHDPGHRGGVPYANRDVANRFRGGGFGGAANARQFGGQGGESNALNGVSDVTVLARLLIAYDRYWPAVQDYENPFTPALVAALKASKIPVIAFSSTNIRPEWPSSVEQSAHSTGSDDVTFKKFPGWGHVDVLCSNQSEREVYAPLAEWLKRHQK